MDSTGVAFKCVSCGEYRHQEKDAVRNHIKKNGCKDEGITWVPLVV